eukprot:jgi/Hompol1/2087/HPOL_005838-RA
MSASWTPPRTRKQTAEDYKLKGNIFFQQKLFDDAIKEYSSAIIQNPEEAVYFQNRALCFLRTSKWDRAIIDCRKAIALAPSSATASLKKAYELSIAQRVNFSEDIARAYLQARKRKWEIAEKRRRENESKLYKYLSDLIQDERNRALAELQSDDAHKREEINHEHKREVPEYFLGKITFEMMSDPVITPSGI